jgi:hypothetical protein
MSIDSEQAIFRHRQFFPFLKKQSQLIWKFIGCGVRK